jgi:hypothetical protein
MATTTYKVLAQSGSSGNYGNGAVTLTATTNTNLYTVPAATQTVVSTLVIANQAASAATYRIGIRPAGATIALHQYIAYDVAVAANDSTALTLGICLGATDQVFVYASAATLTFTMFGNETA